MNKYSVVIAAYNQRDLVLEAVRSVTRQKLPAHEIIVIVDGSPDDTAAALKSTFPQVRVIEESNRGKCIARNTGIAVASGDWIAFLDHDDLWHEDKLFEIDAYLQANSACFAVNHPSWVFSAKEEDPSELFGLQRDFVANNIEDLHSAVRNSATSQNTFEYLHINGDSFNLLLARNRGNLSGSVIKREVLIRAGCFSPMQTNGEDWTMFVNVARICEWHTVDKKLGFIRLHNEQDTKTISTSGLIILVGIAHAWFTGRPLKAHAAGLQFVPILKTYGPFYRQMAQTALWDALRKGQFKLASLIWSVSRLLLPSFKDWVFIHIPPQLSWRWQKLCNPTPAKSKLAKDSAVWEN